MSMSKKILLNLLVLIFTVSLSAIPQLSPRQSSQNQTPSWINGVVNVIGASCTAAASWIAGNKMYQRTRSRIERMPLPSYRGWQKRLATSNSTISIEYKHKLSDSITIRTRHKAFPHALDDAQWMMSAPDEHIRHHQQRTAVSDGKFAGFLTACITAAVVGWGVCIATKHVKNWLAQYRAKQQAAQRSLSVRTKSVKKI